MACSSKRNDEEGPEDSTAGTGSPRGPPTIVPSSTDGRATPNQANDEGGEATQPVTDGGGAPGERTRGALMESTGGGGPSQTCTGGTAPSQSPTEERQVGDEQLVPEMCAMCSEQIDTEAVKKSVKKAVKKSLSSVSICQPCRIKVMNDFCGQRTEHSCCLKKNLRN